eukprot:3020342-Amphidinium_carterae.1
MVLLVPDSTPVFVSLDPLRSHARQEGYANARSVFERLSLGHRLVEVYPLASGVIRALSSHHRVGPNYLGAL